MFSNPASLHSTLLCTPLPSSSWSHTGVSGKRSAVAPFFSVVWNKPRKWPSSCARMRETSLGVCSRSIAETTNPPLDVPLMRAVPGGPADMPRMVAPPRLWLAISLTKNTGIARGSWGAARRSRPLNSDVSSSFMSTTAQRASSGSSKSIQVASTLTTGRGEVLAQLAQHLAGVRRRLHLAGVAVFKAHQRDLQPDHRAPARCDRRGEQLAAHRLLLCRARPARWRPSCPRPAAPRA